MTTFRVIPVLDIKEGVVVHAVRGERDRYMPIKSVLCKSAKPLDVALALRRIFNFRELYIADIDSITGSGDNYDVISEIVRSAEFDSVIVDAGIDSVEDAKELFNVGVDKAIVATETLSSLDRLDALLSRFGSGRLVLSMDFCDNRMVSPCGDLAGIDPIGAVEIFNKYAFEEAIFIDLARVGSELGFDIGTISRMVDKARMQVIVGGGARNVRDVLLLKRVGAAGVLIATALHKGRVKAADLRLLK
jgi:phosphoribosylformimino-5-aminoimidazole carboxamide ribotide isomerase